MFRDRTEHLTTTVPGLHLCHHSIHACARVPYGSLKRLQSRLTELRAGRNRRFRDQDYSRKLQQTVQKLWQDLQALPAARASGVLGWQLAKAGNSLER